MKKTLSAILTLVLLCTSAFASPVLMGTVDSAQEKGAVYTETAASLTEEANDILGQLIFHESFDTDNIRVSGDSATLAAGQSWNYISDKVSDITLGYSSFRFLRGDSGYNGKALLTRQTDGDNGYMWVRTDASAGTTYPGFVFQFRNSNNKSIVVKEGTYTLCMKVYSPEGNGITSAGIRARVTDGVDGYGYRSGSLIDPSTTWETYLPAEQGTWSYIWSTYTASESKPLSGFYVMNNGGNANGIADFRSFYIDDVSLYYIPSDKTATNTYTFSFVDGDKTTTLTAQENTKVALPALVSDKEFLGWSETENGEILSNTALICIGDKTLYAVWGNEYKTNPLIDIDFFANAPVNASNYTYGMEATLSNLSTGASTCDITHAVIEDSDGTMFRRFLAQKDGDLKFQFGGSVTHNSKQVPFDDTKGAIMRVRFNAPSDSEQPASKLTVKNIYSLMEGGYLDPAATAYIDTSIVGKWQYVYFDYSSISGKNGSMRRFDVFGLKKGWSLDVDYIHFILDSDVEYDVSTPEISFEKTSDGAVVKYTFDGELSLTSAEFDAIAGGHNFGASEKTTDEKGNTVYSYLTTLEKVSGKTLPNVIDGLSYESGKVSGIFLPNVDFESVNPTTVQLASIRTATPSGLRVMGFTADDTKSASDEIGFIIARADAVTNVNDLVFGANPKEGKANVNDKGIVYVFGSAYLKNSHDKIYALNSKDAGIDGDARYKDLEGYFFTAALVGITADKYDHNFICRPYIKSGSTYFYGKAITRNIREVAQNIANSGYKGLNESEIQYINSIIEA